MNENIFDQTIARVSAEGRNALSEIESKQILAAMGVRTQMPEAARTADQAAAIAERNGFPVVLKLLSPDVTHKSDVGGVVLGLGTQAEVRDAFERIRGNLAKAIPSARFDGVAVQPMAAPGLELLVGVTRDRQFGPTVMVGLGGILVEVLKDTSIRIAPVGEGEALAMLSELKGGALLDGVRGSAAVDRNAIASLLVKISEFAARHPEIKEMDLNPVVAYPSGLSVLDARMLLSPAGKDDGPGAFPTPEQAAHQARRQENLKRAFHARVAVVVGERKRRDFMWLHAFDKFKGTRYSVQADPKEAEEVEKLGIKNFRSIAEVPEPIDYVLASVPRKFAPQTLADCVAAKVPGMAFFTAGFSETGEQIGFELEAEMKKIASQSDIAVVGPNCMAISNPSIGMLNSANLSAGDPGDVCFISQSGTHTVSFGLQAPGHGIKVSMAASIGNALVLDGVDYLEVMAADPTTRVIGMYLEGVGGGRRLFESLRRITPRIPVLIWKGGVTEAGAHATFSHTGSLATPTAVWRAVLRQTGAVEVAGLEAMLDAIHLLTRTLPVKGRGMALVAMTGGQSVLISDTFAKHGLEVPRLSESTYAEFKTFFQVIGGSYRNPLDAASTLRMGSSGEESNVDRVLGLLERDPVIDAIVMEHRPGLGFPSRKDKIDAKQSIPMLNKLQQFAQRAKKPFAIAVESDHVAPGGKAQVIEETIALARERGLAAFNTFDHAAAAFRVAAEYYERTGGGLNQGQRE